MSDETKENEVTSKKQCFIITPIGEEGSKIRRHIDGVINAAIKPTLQDKYEVIVPHEISKSGSINKDIISNLYKDELVIANLTELNPNVMYELAFRHSLRKPVITIMEMGGKLPFDIGDYRTIFYVNDYQGLIDLKNNLAKTIEEIENKSPKVDNPIYTALDGLETEKIINQNTSKTDDSLKYILDRLDKIDSKLENSGMNEIYSNSGFAKIYDSLRKSEAGSGVVPVLNLDKQTLKQYYDMLNSKNNLTVG